VAREGSWGTLLGSVASHAPPPPRFALPSLLPWLAHLPQLLPPSTSARNPSPLCCLTSSTPCSQIGTPVYMVRADVLCSGQGARAGTLFCSRAGHCSCIMGGASTVRGRALTRAGGQLLPALSSVECGLGCSDAQGASSDQLLHLWNVDWDAQTSNQRRRPLVHTCARRGRWRVLPGALQHAKCSNNQRAAAAAPLSRCCRARS